MLETNHIALELETFWITSNVGTLKSRLGIDRYREAPPLQIARTKDMVPAAFKVLTI
jgi:hypothetical protein